MSAVGYVLGMRLSIRAASLFGCALLSALSAPVAVQAEGRWCEWGREGTYAARAPLHCYADEKCSATCSTRGQSDLACVTGSCVPPCTTIRLCSLAADCARGESCLELAGVRPPIVDSPGFAPTGVCVAPDASLGHVPPRDAFCRDTWESWEDGYLYDVTLPVFGTRSLHTPSWGFGDADHDGCANEVDGSVCTDDGAPCLTVEPRRPVNCPSEPSVDRCCRFSPAGLECSSDAGMCACSTIHACTPGPRPYPADDCRFSGTGAAGLCVRPPDSGALGVCLFEEFFESCTDPASLVVGDACFRDPSSGLLTENFYQGDCDGDGCPNGQDSDRCRQCDGARCGTMSVDTRTDCVSIVGAGLDDPDRCFADAGVSPDASTVSLDAALDPQTDAAFTDAPSDASSTPTDAPAMDAPSVPTPHFGGAGCRCRTLPSTEPSRMALGAFALSASFVLAATRRSRARRRRRSLSSS